MDIIAFDRQAMEQVQAQTMAVLGSQKNNAQSRLTVVQNELTIARQDLATAQQQLATANQQLAAAQQSLAAAMNMPPF